MWQQVKSQEKIRQERNDAFIESLRKMQDAMQGEAKRASLTTEEEINALCKEVRDGLVY